MRVKNVCVYIDIQNARYRARAFCWMGKTERVWGSPICYRAPSIEYVKVAIKRTLELRTHQCWLQFSNEIGLPDEMMKFRELYT